MSRSSRGRGRNDGAKRGCGLIGGIGEKLNHHPALMEFIHIAHLLEGPGHEGFTKESLLPDIMVACRELAAVQA